MSKQKISSRHHFIPRFLLKEWKDDAGDLWVYQRNGGGEISYRKGAPKSVAYVDGLYTLFPEHRLSKPASDEIEKEVMAKLDDRAAIIHKVIIDQGVNAISEEDRYIWAVFIASMIERTPHRLKEYKDRANIEDLIRELNEAYPGADQLVDKFGFDVKALVNNTTLKFMVDRILSHDLALDIAKMEWIVVRINSPGEHFVLGDRALVVNNAPDVEEPLYFIRLAIAPDKLMLLAFDSSIVDHDFISALTMTYNVTVMERSERYVISSRELVNGSHTKFDRIIREMHRV
ncbi:DUF4238 domain-containing protein [Pseudomonas sp. ES1]|uniref:DUF4238 domain-containing protein n=1 Tax=Pseudomonas sp. ES1 TaxID=3424775 RepID=UPI003D346728